MERQYTELLEKAKALARPKDHNKSCSSGHVGSALITDKGNIYTGVSIDASCGIGFCAEHGAIARMVTGGETRIKAIVAVSAAGQLLPPCGRCREFIFQVDYENLDADVIMDGQILKLKDLLNHRWQEAWGSD